MRFGETFAPRLVLAIISILLEEGAIFVIWRWALPHFDIELPLYVLVTIMVGWLVYAVATFIIVTRALGKKAFIGLQTMVGSKGKVARPLAPEGMVRIKGELWGATSEEGKMDIGEEVTVVGEDGLKLIVRKGGPRLTTR